MIDLGGEPSSALAFACLTKALLCVSLSVLRLSEPVRSTASDHLMLFFRENRLSCLARLMVSYVAEDKCATKWKEDQKGEAKQRKKAVTQEVMVSWLATAW